MDSSGAAERGEKPGATGRLTMNLLKEVLASGVKILPAMGGAVEDLQHPDAAGIDALLVNLDVGRVTVFHKKPEPSTASLYRPTPPLPRAERHPSTYFIDGSLRTYYLPTGIEGQWNRTSLAAC